MANFAYSAGKKWMLDVIGTSLQVMLLQSTYTPDAEHTLVSEISAYEVSVAGYARQPLQNGAVTIDATAHKARLDADDVTFAGMATGQTVRAAVLYVDAGIDSTCTLVAYVELGDVSSLGDLTIAWATLANGAVMRM